MALDANYLFKIGHGGENNVFLYTSTDPITEVDDADYFLGAQDRIREHDVIIHVDTDTNTVDVLMVSASTTATVTTVNGT